MARGKKHAPEQIGELTSGRDFGAAIILRHHKDFFPTPFQRLAHAPFTFSLVIIPSVVREINAAVNGRLE